MTWTGISRCNARSKVPLKASNWDRWFFFNSDIELVDFLKKVNEGDEQKYFEHLPSDDIEVARKERGDAVKTDHYRKNGMIA